LRLKNAPINTKSNTGGHAWRADAAGRSGWKVSSKIKK